MLQIASFNFVLNCFTTLHIYRYRFVRVQCKRLPQKHHTLYVLLYAFVNALQKTIVAGLQRIFTKACWLSSRTNISIAPQCTLISRAIKFLHILHKLLRSRSALHNSLLDFIALRRWRRRPCHFQKTFHF